MTTRKSLRRIRDGHAEGRGTLGDGLADAPHADDAQARTAHLALQRHRTLEPFASTHEAVGRRQLARHAQHQAERRIGDLVVQHIGRMRDHHAAPPGRGHVDAVVAHAHHRDQLQRRQLRHQLVADTGLALGGDGADAGRRRGQRGGVGLVQAVVQREQALQLLRIHRREPGGGQHLRAGGRRGIGSRHRAYTASGLNRHTIVSALPRRHIPGKASRR
jgi:hypothetical protein